MEATRARAVLARTLELDCTQLAALIEAAYRAAKPARALGARLLRQLQLPAAARSFLLAPDEAATAQDLEWLAATGTHILLCTDRDYPPLLRQLSDAPAVLYVQGSLAALHDPQLAMVGSRNPSLEGRRTAREFAAWFARAGLSVTSGLSRGIEAAARTPARCVAADSPSRCAARDLIASIRLSTAHSPHRSPRTAPWSRSCRRAPCRSASTSYGATASSPD